MQALRLENERLKNSLDPSSVVRPGPVTRGLKETHGSFFLTNYFLLLNKVKGLIVLFFLKIHEK